MDSIIRKKISLLTLLWCLVGNIIVIYGARPGGRTPEEVSAALERARERAARQPQQPFGTVSQRLEEVQRRAVSYAAPVSRGSMEKRLAEAQRRAEERKRVGPQRLERISQVRQGFEDIKNSEEEWKNLPFEQFKPKTEQVIADLIKYMQEVPAFGEEWLWLADDIQVEIKELEGLLQARLAFEKEQKRQAPTSHVKTPRERPKAPIAGLLPKTQARLKAIEIGLQKDLNAISTAEFAKTTLEVWETNKQRIKEEYSKNSEAAQAFEQLYDNFIIQLQDKASQLEAAEAKVKTPLLLKTPVSEKGEPEKEELQSAIKALLAERRQLWIQLAELKGITGGEEISDYLTKIIPDYSEKMKKAVREKDFVQQKKLIQQSMDQLREELKKARSASPEASPTLLPLEKPASEKGRRFSLGESAGLEELSEAESKRQWEEFERTYQPSEPTEEEEEEERKGKKATPEEEAAAITVQKRRRGILGRRRAAVAAVAREFAQESAAAKREELVSSLVARKEEEIKRREEKEASIREEKERVQFALNKVTAWQENLQKATKDWKDYFYSVINNTEERTKVLSDLTYFIQFCTGKPRFDEVKNHLSRLRNLLRREGKEYDGYKNKLEEHVNSPLLQINDQRSNVSQVKEKARKYLRYWNEELNKLEQNKETEYLVPLIKEYLIKLKAKLDAAS